MCYVMYVFFIYFKYFDIGDGEKPARCDGARECWLKLTGWFITERELLWSQTGPC